MCLTILSLNLSRFSITNFIKLKELAKNTVGASNSIFESELTTLLYLHQNLDSEICKLESEIIKLVSVLERPTMTIPGIGPLSAAVILSEYGDICRFSGPASMLSFAGLEPGYYQSGISSHTGHMVKRGSSIPVSYT